MSILDRTPTLQPSFDELGNLVLPGNDKGFTGAIFNMDTR